MAKPTETRKIVLDMLVEMRTGEVKSNLLLRNVLNKYDYLDNRDKAFIKKLFIGCVQYQIALDSIINKYAKTKNGKIKPVVRDILRMGIYQIIYMDQVPDSAACNESVSLAIMKGLGSLKGFVNGVLRNIARQKEEIVNSKDPSIKYSMPEWIVSLLKQQYEDDTVIAILEDSLRDHDVVIRVDERYDAISIVDRIKSAGIGITKHPMAPMAYELTNVPGLEQVPGFDEGRITVQDVSSQLCVELADIKPGDKVLDVCAAPGGKTMHAACKCGPDGYVDARDLTEYKVDYIQDNADRMKLENVHVKVFDATVLDESAIEKYDVVICDLPCSGLGVMGRKPDIKYNSSLEGIKELATLQRKILDVAYKYVKKGGTLIYSTCTITREEDEDNRDYILKNLPFESVKLQGKDYIKLLPGVDNCDGFFISRFIRKAE